MVSISSIRRDLPYEIISHIISFTSPGDACRFATLSTYFRTTFDDDDVWNKFLPNDCNDILAQSECTMQFTSKKQLYFHLCQPLYLRHDNVIFWLEKSSGKKCYRLCHGRFTASKDALLFLDFYIPAIRMTEVVNVMFFEAEGVFDSRKLSPRTTYAAYLLVDVIPSSYASYSPPAELSVKLGDNTRFRRYSRLKVPSRGATGIAARRSLVPRRDDSLMEIELGKFYNEDGQDGEVVMGLVEGKDHAGAQELGCFDIKTARAMANRNLIIQGFEIRPHP